MKGATDAAGVSLAADIYYPALGDARTPGMFPVILERTPYNKAAPAQVTRESILRDAATCA